MRKSLQQKLAILSDAAKYDASCASGSTAKRNSAGGNGLGSTEGSGICHAYAPDGRCISLLKILMTNFCIYDCVYCVNRVSSNVARARFTPEEIIWLTLEFYRRNFIEGLFLSSGIIKSPDDTMADMLRVVRELRTTHRFNGYIHLKTIPAASKELVEEAGLYADRLSVNIELPTDAGVARYAPQKSPVAIRKAMADVRLKIDEAKEASPVTRKRKRFAPGGQSTQMIVGADDTSDAEVLARSESLYAGYKLRRVYYSAFSPIPDASSALPLIRPPLMREHRLYQADWLTRFYGFTASEVMTARPGGMLDLDIDPKLAWALANRHVFPLDVNTSARELLLRVPGFGTRTVQRILSSRRLGRLRYVDLLRLGALMNKAKAFVTCLDWTPGPSLDAEGLRRRFLPPPEQLALF